MSLYACSVCSEAMAKPAQDCVLVIVALERSPLEDVRESRLRSVTEHHCHSAKGFNWKSLATKKKNRLQWTAFPPFPSTSHTQHWVYTSCYNSSPPDQSLSPESPVSQLFLLNWREMKVVSSSSQLIANILWKWPCFFSSSATLAPHIGVVCRITPSPPDECAPKRTACLWIDRYCISVWNVISYSFAVPLCWPFWLSCWRALWPCRSRCWEERAFWWLDTC